MVVPLGDCNGTNLVFPLGGGTGTSLAPGGRRPLGGGEATAISLAPGGSEAGTSFEPNGTELTGTSLVTTVEAAVVGSILYPELAGEVTAPNLVVPGGAQAERPPPVGGSGTNLDGPDCCFVTGCLF